MEDVKSILPLPSANLTAADQSRQEKHINARRLFPSIQGDRKAVPDNHSVVVEEIYRSKKKKRWYRYARLLEHRWTTAFELPKRRSQKRATNVRRPGALELQVMSRQPLPFQVQRDVTIHIAARLFLPAPLLQPCVEVRPSRLPRCLRPTEARIHLVVGMAPWLVSPVPMTRMKEIIAEVVDLVEGGNLYQRSSGMAVW